MKLTFVFILLSPELFAIESESSVNAKYEILSVKVLSGGVKMLMDYIQSKEILGYFKEHSLIL